MKIFILTILGLLFSVQANTYYHSEKYESSLNKTKVHKRKRAANETVNIHIFAHTHDDVGWLKTVDQYYTGSDQADQHAEVNLVITTVVDELQKNPDRKFTYVEIKFFSMWWDL